MRIVLAAAVAAALSGCGQQSAPVANDDRVAVFLGKSAAIDVLANDAAANGALDASSIDIVTAPLAGVLDVDATNGTIRYRHNGISTDSDAFSYRAKDAKGASSNVATVTVEVSLSDARVEILQPHAGADVAGATLTVSYAVAGSGFNHLHLSIDGAGHNTITELTGTYTFTNVPPGAHVISADLVDADHRPINAPSSNDSVTVNVVR